jgi:predicted GH43/DUF377 family glycosyl hydrolase
LTIHESKLDAMLRLCPLKTRGDSLRLVRVSLHLLSTIALCLSCTQAFAGGDNSVPDVTLTLLDRTTQPLLKADRPWEDYCIGYCQVMRIGGTWHMWYASYDHAYRNDADGHLCYARSNDGVTWEKPNLGLVEFNGSRDNNILIARGIHGHCVLHDEAAPAAERFKMVYCDLTTANEWHVFAATSPDGLQWTLSEKPILARNSDTQQTIVRDGDTYRLYVRLWTGPAPFTGNRIVGLSSSKDFQQFPDPAPVLQADAKDPPNMQFYNPAVSKLRDNLYLMLPSGLYTGEDAVRVHAAVSSDGEHFRRVANRPLLELGQGFDRMGIYVAPGAIPSDRPDEYWFYYTGSNAGHDASTPDKLKFGGGIGRFRLKVAPASASDRASGTR